MWRSRYFFSGCPRIARVTSLEELGTMSKNNLIGLTLIRRPIWGIHSLTLIISWFVGIYLNAKPERKKDISRMVFQQRRKSIRDNVESLGHWRSVAWLKLKGFQRDGRKQPKHVYRVLMLSPSWDTVKLHQSALSRRLLRLTEWDNLSFVENSCILYKASRDKPNKPRRKQILRNTPCTLKWLGTYKGSNEA